MYALTRRVGGFPAHAFNSPMHTGKRITPDHNRPARYTTGWQHGRLVSEVNDHHWAGNPPSLPVGFADLLK
jgi:hypothetical protein